MAKWADYLISAVRFSKNGDHRYISHVLLHEDGENSIGIGVKKTKDEVIKLIDDEKTVRTIRWSYQTALWNNGAEVSTEKRGDIRYLRTHPDASVQDNLDNLLPLGDIGH